jgi:hypothetical protein
MRRRTGKETTPISFSGERKMRLSLGPNPEARGKAPEFDPDSVGLKNAVSRGGASAEELKLKKGDSVEVIIKSTEVMLRK